MKTEPQSKMAAEPANSISQASLESSTATSHSVRRIGKRWASMIVLRNLLLALLVFSIVLISTYWVRRPMAEVTEPAAMTRVEYHQLRGEAQAAAEQRDWAQVREKAERLVGWTQDDGEVWQWLSDSYLALGYYDHAAESYRMAIRFPDRAATNYYNLACALTHLGKTREAFQMLDAAIDAGFDDGDFLAADDDLLSLHGEKYFERMIIDLRPRGFISARRAP